MFENQLELYMNGIFVNTEHLQAILEHKLQIAIPLRRKSVGRSNKNEGNLPLLHLALSSVITFVLYYTCIWCVIVLIMAALHSICGHSILPLWCLLFSCLFSADGDWMWS